MRKVLLTLLALLLAAALLTGCDPRPLMDLLANQAAKGARTATTADTPEVEYEVMDDGLALYESAMPMMAVNGAAFMPMPDFNTEEYASVKENGFKRVRSSPLSTFSADVDTASYCNLRRMLNDGWSPDDIPAGAVRVEEMLNYIRYGYAAPTGGDKFGVTAQIGDCPWNADAKLLVLGVRAADAPEAVDEGSNLVFLIDVSGSMNDPHKLDLVKQALALLTEQLTDRDTLSICTYSDGERVVIEGAKPVTDKAKIMSALDGLEAMGYTDGQRGLEQAYEVAMRYYRPHGNNRVIMCSDGDLNVGITSESDLHDFVSEKRKTGIYLSVLGFGDGNYKDTKMETLADDGNGNYYYIDSILEARKVLAEELTQTMYAVADDVKFQIEFNPAKVSAWRQVGYENRALDDADFTDDKKDAGEVGAGAAVTVLYELIPADGADAGDTGLKYQSGALTDAAQSGEWLTLSIRYKEPGGAASALETKVVGDADVAEAPSGDFTFAAAVAEFGMLLTDSEYKGTTDYASILDLLKKAELSDDYREELFSLVKIAQRASRLGQ